MRKAHLPTRHPGLDPGSLAKKEEKQLKHFYEKILARNLNIALSKTRHHRHCEETKQSDDATHLMMSKNADRYVILPRDEPCFLEMVVRFLHFGRNDAGVVRIVEERRLL